MPLVSTPMPVRGSHLRRFANLAVCSLVCLASLAGSISDAWGQTGTASVYGEVLDQQRQVVAAATVTLTHAETGTFYTTVTDERGAYRFVILRPGTYTIKVELKGFKTTVAANVPVLVETTTRHNLLLEVGAITDTVNVGPESARINTTHASLANALA